LKSRIGHISLVAAITGFLLVELAIHQGWVEGPLWRIIATGFEAGTIGALADWFAVSALFYEIPIPLVRRHTNIIVKNRQKLTEGIVEMVTEKWLSPDIIREKLANENLVHHIIQLLEEPKNLTKTLEFVRQVFLRFTEGMAGPSVAAFLQQMMKDQVKDFELAAPLGRWIAEVVQKQQHLTLTRMVIDEISKAIQEPETRRIIRLKLKEGLSTYAKEDKVKQATVWLAKRVGGIDLDLITDRIMDITLLLSQEIKDDPTHPFRQKLDGFLLEFADNLQQGDPSSVQFVTDLKERLILNEEAGSLIQRMLGNLQLTLARQLQSVDTELMISIRSGIIRYLNELKQNVEIQQNMDVWLKESITKMINRYHPQIGNLVRSSLEKLDDREMMVQIKEKVGDDLQYIRLNGAVVGGMVGVLIATFRWLIG